MNPKTAIEIELKPWEQVLEGFADVAHISRAESREHGAAYSNPSPALPEPPSYPQQTTTQSLTLR